MNAGEYGIALNLNVNFDISGNTSLSLAFTRPDGSTLTVTNPQVTYGTVALSTSIGTFAANQYATYTTKSGDIPLPGTYSVRLTYTDSSKSLKSDIATFQVNS